MAFAYCKKLSSVTVKCKTPPTAKSNAFLDVKATLYVPYGTKDLYEAAVGWNVFTDIVEMEITEINTNQLGTQDLVVKYLGFASLL